MVMQESLSCTYIDVQYASKKSVCKVSNSREITLEVLRGAREMCM